MTLTCNTNIQLFLPADPQGTKTLSFDSKIMRIQPILGLNQPLPFDLFTNVDNPPLSYKFWITPIWTATLHSSNLPT